MENNTIPLTRTITHPPTTITFNQEEYYEVLRNIRESLAKIAHCAEAIQEGQTPENHAHWIDTIRKEALLNFKLTSRI